MATLVSALARYRLGVAIVRVGIRVRIGVELG